MFMALAFSFSSASASLPSLRTGYAVRKGEDRVTASVARRRRGRERIESEKGSLSAGDGFDSLIDFLLRGRLGDDRDVLGGALGHPGYRRDHPLQDPESTLLLEGSRGRSRLVLERERERERESEGGRGERYGG
jgi:hypothetical protein